MENISQDANGDRPSFDESYRDARANRVIRNGFNTLGTLSERDTGTRRASSKEAGSHVFRSVIVFCREVGAVTSRSPVARRQSSRGRRTATSLDGFLNRPGDAGSVSNRIAWPKQQWSGTPREKPPPWAWYQGCSTKGAVRSDTARDLSARSLAFR